MDSRSSRSGSSSGTAAISSSTQRSSTDFEVIQIPGECPFFVIRLCVVTITLTFCCLGVIMLAIRIFVEKAPGFTSVAERHGIDTGLMALLLIAGPGFIILLEVLRPCSAELGGSRCGGSRTSRESSFLATTSSRMAPSTVISGRGNAASSSSSTSVTIA